MKTILLITITSLAVAGMSFAGPMSKRSGPWKSKRSGDKGYGSGASSMIATGLPYKKKIEHRHSSFQGSSQMRLQRLHNKERSKMEIPRIRPLTWFSNQKGARTARTLHGG